MVTPTTVGTRDVPLRFARFVTEQVNREWEDGSFIAKVTPITQDLLRFWFYDGFCETRKFNFHEGQRQAILNTIYLHEILKTKSVAEMYTAIKPELLREMALLDLEREKFKHPKYAVKMATGTGKTWVLNALLIWQYLNAKHEEKPSGLFLTNFLLVAPGLIVYERLLDAYLGKEQEDGTRNFEESDLKKFEDLFVPPAYKEELFGFIQSAVAKKEEIGRKVTGDGLIAITNWHLLAGVEDEEETESPLDDPTRSIKELLPITPGTSAGHVLESLDNRYFSGNEIEYLVKLPGLVVFNDEAHHIHEVKKAGEIFEVEWQKSLLKLAEEKQESFIQIDFSATPYNVTGSGQNRVPHFFPHIIVDFNLITAIKNGYVKTIALDRRDEIATLPLDFQAIREGTNVVDLSDGQRVMLRAGLQKLRILEQQFVELTKDESGASNKHPKMLVVCEDTKVAPLVVRFLTTFEGLSADDVMEIHSDKKGNVTKKQWDEDKQKLFSIDKHENPKVIVSVLMLKEGFDVNNICVIVPLRASTALILLEQIIGRGLRLMWREPEFTDVKAENRERLLVKKLEPLNYLDILSIIEHPEFIKFYQELIKDGGAVETKDPIDKDHVLGDIIKVGLRQGYESFDFYWPIIIQDKEENLVPVKLSYEQLEPLPYKLEDLKRLVQKDDKFISIEITVRTRFGEYTVSSEIFTAKSYNDFIAKLVTGVTTTFVPTGKGSHKKSYPLIQVNAAGIAKLSDDYIRHRLFNQEFDPFEDNNWRVLLLSQGEVIRHIIKNISKSIYDLQNSVEITDAKVLKRYFSEISEIKIREKYALDISKVIYEKIAYPSNKGEFERRFITFIDADSKVSAFIKINEYNHDFAHITYIREDGLLSHYYPDFIVKIASRIYLVETKAEKDINNPNVKQKRLATIDWISKVNQLKPEDRMDSEWNYILLGENTFYQLESRGASTEEILEYAKMSKAKVEGRLDFDQK